MLLDQHDRATPPPPGSRVVIEHARAALRAPRRRRGPSCWPSSKSTRDPITCPARRGRVGDQHEGLEPSASPTSPPAITQRMRGRRRRPASCAPRTRSSRRRLGPGHHIVRSTTIGSPLVDRTTAETAPLASGRSPEPAGICSSSTQIVKRARSPAPYTDLRQRRHRWPGRYCTCDGRRGRVRVGDQHEQVEEGARSRLRRGTTRAPAPSRRRCRCRRRTAGRAGSDTSRARR